MTRELQNEASIPSPALLIDLDAVDENLRLMLKIAGEPARLRPHVKTHKLPQLVAAQVALGITKFKCATIAEAEMTAEAGGKDILLAIAPVGPNVSRLLALQRKFPDVDWLTITDDIDHISALSGAACKEKMELAVLIDLDVGQHRSGVSGKEKVKALYEKLTSLPGLKAGGLHAYDGHIHQANIEERVSACDLGWDVVTESLDVLKSAGCPTPVRIVAGGTPTFPLHANRHLPGLECSPGTCVLWDAGYAGKFPDMPFRHAAWLLTRVISRPGLGLQHLCLDLGHKAVGSEMPHPRVLFPELTGATVVMHNEEHLVIHTPRAEEFPPGSVVRGIPWHVCPTVALHSECHAIRDGRLFAVWPVTARARRITI